MASNLAEIKEKYNFLKKNYHLKIETEIKKLNSILKSLDNTKWHKTTNLLKNNVKNCKLINNKIIFKDKILQRSLLNPNQLLKNKEFNQIVYNPQIILILTEYFKKKPVLKKIDVFYSENDGTFSKENNKQGWHIDEPHLQKKGKKFCKLFIPLCEVNEKNGPTNIVRGSRENLPPSLKFEKMKSERYSDKFIRSYYKETDIFPLTCKFGEIYLARTDGFHKGGFVKKGYRIIIIVEYNPEKNKN